MAGRYGLDAMPRSRRATIVASRSTPGGSRTTDTNQDSRAAGMPSPSRPASGSPDQAGTPRRAGRQPDHVHEPGLARGGDAEPVAAVERLRVPGGDAPAVGQHPVEPLELLDADRAGDVGQAVVEAEAVVIQPAHVGRAALVALGIDALLRRGVVADDDAALAGRHLLVRVEGEDRRVSAGADGGAVAVPRAERLAG